MSSVTLESLKNRVWAQLDDNTRFYPAAEVTRAINDSFQQLNLFTGIVQGPQNITTEANRFFYPLPASIIVPFAADLDGRQLKRSSLRHLSSRRQNWLKEATTGPPSVWVPVGNRTLAIYPKDSVGGRTLRIVGVLEPTLLVNNSDEIDLPDEMTDAIEDLAVLGLQLKEGGKPFADASTKYQDFLRDVTIWQRWRGIKHPRFFIESAEEAA